MQKMLKCKTHKKYKNKKTLRRQLLDKKCKNTKRAKHAKRAKKIKIALARQLLVLRTCFIVSLLYLSVRDQYDVHYILPWQMNSCFTNLSSWDRFFPDSSDFPDISYILPWQMNNCFTNLRQIFPDFPDFADIYYITPWQMNSCFTKQISKATNNLSGQNVMYTWEIWKVVEKKIFLTVLVLTVCRLVTDENLP